MSKRTRRLARKESLEIGILVRDAKAAAAVVVELDRATEIVKQLREEGKLK